MKSAVKAEISGKATVTPRQRQVLDGPWKLETKIGDQDGPGMLVWPFGIAVNPTSDTIAIVESDRPTKQVQLYGSDFVHTFSLDTSQGFKPGTHSHPWQVILGANTMCYVTTATQYVVMYVSDGVYKGKWAAVSPRHKTSDAEDTDLRGLTMNNRGHVLVGEIKHRYISRHKKDGLHVASIKVDIAPWSLAVTSQDSIIVSDWSESVHIVDDAGQLLHIVKPPSHIQELNPTGVACFGDTFFVCNYGAKKIHCFSLSHKYLGDIPIKIQGAPKCLAFTPNGKRLIVSYLNFHGPNGVAVYKLDF